MVNWNFGKRDQSLKFFADRGHKQVIAGYYDGKIEQVSQWLDSAAKVQGVMYTTWRGPVRRHGGVCETVREVISSLLSGDARTFNMPGDRQMIDDHPTSEREGQLLGRLRRTPKVAWALLGHGRIYEHRIPWSAGAMCRRIGLHRDRGRRFKGVAAAA